jgi:hypothetical protein
MAEEFHLTAEEWQALEERLREAERHAHEEYFATEEYRNILGVGDVTPGTLLLRKLIGASDTEGVWLLRAMEMYQHELTRHGYAAAFRLGQEMGRKKMAAAR